MRNIKTILSSSAALALFACGGGNDSSTLKMAIAVPGAAANALTAAVTATASANGLTLTDGTNTLVITTAEVVIEEIELKRSGADECHAQTGILLTQQAPLTAKDGSDDPAGHDGTNPPGTTEANDAGDDNGTDANDGDANDKCEKFETGPQLVALPLDGSVTEQISATVPAGTYDRLEFKVHKLSGDHGTDILRDRPDLDGVSVHVIGTFNGTPFVFVSSESYEQKVDLSPPLAVTADAGAVNLTLSIDVTKWFANADGNLVDPSTVEQTNVISSSMDGSFACFEDDDHDGVAHDQDEDEGGHHQGGDHTSGHDGADDNAPSTPTAANP